MSQTESIEINCDPKTGLCEIPDFNSELKDIKWKAGEEIIYVGDPMCSWCWGISPHLNALERYGQSESIPFTIVMGGLRPGGGEAWDEKFKGFLKHHWEEVSGRSGQPFGFDLFELENFDYDTEPACRAVVTVRQLDPTKTTSFYELVQHHFYVKNKDPKQVEFYRAICDQLAINFEEFSSLFLSEEMKEATHNDFARSSQMGITGFPTVIYRKDNQLYAVARGYAEFDQMKERILAIGNEKSKN